MNRITPIHFEWNCLNGFIIQILGIDIREERSLFGLYFSKDFIHIELLFFYIEIWNRKSN
jgi:hypothetical protein